MSEDIVFTNALKVINTLDNGKPFVIIKDIVAVDAVFECQADAMKDIKTVQGYNEWMVAFGSTSTAITLKYSIIIYSSFSGCLPAFMCCVHLHTQPPSKLGINKGSKTLFVDSTQLISKVQKVPGISRVLFDPFPNCSDCLDFPATSKHNVHFPFRRSS